MYVKSQWQKVFIENMANKRGRPQSGFRSLLYCCRIRSPPPFHSHQQTTIDYLKAAKVLLIVACLEAKRPIRQPDYILWWNHLLEADFGRSN